jgi:hypothetical protein
MQNDQSGADTLLQMCLKVVEAHRRRSPLDEALDALEGALQDLEVSRRRVSCGGVIHLDEHSHECVGCTFTVCNTCAIADAGCPACTPDASGPDAAVQDAVIELARVRVTDEDGQHGAEVTLGPWRQVMLEKAREMLQRGEYEIRVLGRTVPLWSPEGRPFRPR